MLELTRLSKMHAKRLIRSVSNFRRSVHKNTRKLVTNLTSKIAQIVLIAGHLGLSWETPNLAGLRGVYKDNFDTNVAMVTLFARLLSNFLLGRSREWQPFAKFAKNSQFSASYNFFVFGPIAK